jgi:4-diphosphocytidyl-2-C-methyl-D-erythritol kinase
MHLHKVIPVGAGLGGGSSDAAFAIKLLNELFSLRLTASQMTERAGRLGSDCAFFIEGKPVFASGKGDQLQPAEMNLSGYTVVILVPPVQISTAEAYKLVEAKKPSENIRTVLSASPREWKDLLVNDFEGPVFRQFPEIRKLKEKLYNDGALYASMTGSGSAVYGLFDRQLPAPGTFAGCTAWTGKLI